MHVDIHEHILQENLTLWSRKSTLWCMAFGQHVTKVKAVTRRWVPQSFAIGRIRHFSALSQWHLPGIGPRTLAPEVGSGNPQRAFPWQAGWWKQITCKIRKMYSNYFKLISQNYATWFTCRKKHAHTRTHVYLVPHVGTFGIILAFLILLYTFHLCWFCIFKLWLFDLWTLQVVFGQIWLHRLRQHVRRWKKTHLNTSTPKIRPDQIAAYVPRYRRHRHAFMQKIFSEALISMVWFFGGRWYNIYI